MDKPTVLWAIDYIDAYEKTYELSSIRGGYELVFYNLAKAIVEEEQSND